MLMNILNVDIALLVYDIKVYILYLKILAFLLSFKYLNVE
jgi:hypothetical protein